MKIVLWKLGSLDHKIFPTKCGIHNFTQMLIDGLSKAAELHIICGPDVTSEVIELDDFEDCLTDDELVDIVVAANGQIHIIEVVKGNKDEENFVCHAFDDCPRIGECPRNS